jgi:hypothetical protein
LGCIPLSEDPKVGAPPALFEGPTTLIIKQTTVSPLATVYEVVMGFEADDVLACPKA